MIGGIEKVDATPSGEPKKSSESRATSSVVPVLPDVTPPNLPPFEYCCATSNAVPVLGRSQALAALTIEAKARVDVRKVTDTKAETFIVDTPTCT